MGGQMGCVPAHEKKNKNENIAIVDPTEVQSIVKSIYEIMMSEQNKLTKESQIKYKLGSANGKDREVKVVDWIWLMLKQKLRKLGEGRRQGLIETDEQICKWMNVCSGLGSLQKKYLSRMSDLTRVQIDGLLRFVSEKQSSLKWESSLDFIWQVIVSKQEDKKQLSQYISFCTTLLKQFQKIEEDENRKKLSNILLQLMLQNKNLIQYANKPYFFMEFLIIYMNKESQMEIQLQLLDKVGKLYQIGAQVADQNLFYDNDFRVFIDLLVRVIEECPNGQKLKIPLKCYLRLSKSSKMQKNYRINDIKQFLNAIDCEKENIIKQKSQIFLLQ